MANLHGKTVQEALCSEQNSGFTVATPQETNINNAIYFTLGSDTETLELQIFSNTADNGVLYGFSNSTSYTFGTTALSSLAVTLYNDQGLAAGTTEAGAPLYEVRVPPALKLQNDDPIYIHFQGLGSSYVAVKLQER